MTAAATASASGVTSAPPLGGSELGCTMATAAGDASCVEDALGLEAGDGEGTDLLTGGGEGL